MPWESSAVTGHRLKQKEAKLKAIEEHLGVLPNGHSVPLTLRQKLLFGSSILKLEYKIKKVREEAKKTVEVIESFKPWEAEMKDTRLMRCFVLECLPPFKRHTLEANYAIYDENTAEKPSWLVYIAAWIFISGTLCFLMYWIFAWGVYEGGATLATWGAIYGTGAAQDILLVQVTKIIILFYLPAQAMQPQLLRIRKVLADVSLNYINRFDREHLTDDNEVEDVRVVQHMSASCRASRSPELRDLPSAWLLRQVPYVPWLSLQHLPFLDRFSTFISIFCYYFLHNLPVGPNIDIDTALCS